MSQPSYSPQVLTRALQRRQQLGELAMMSGDPVLAQTGTGLLNDVKQQEANALQQQRTHVLQQYYEGQNANEAAKNQETARWHDIQAPSLGASTKLRAYTKLQSAYESDAKQYLAGRKIYNDAVDVFQHGRDQTGNLTAPASLSMVMFYMRAHNPSIGVRESGVATATGLGSLETRAKRWLQKNTQGGILTNEQANQMMGAITEIRNGDDQGLAALNHRYRLRAGSLGLAPDEINNLFYSTPGVQDQVLGQQQQQQSAPRLEYSVGTGTPQQTPKPKYQYEILDQ